MPGGGSRTFDPTPQCGPSDSASRYDALVAQEKRIYERCLNVHHLPPIFCATRHICSLLLPSPWVRIPEC